MVETPEHYLLFATQQNQFVSKLTQKARRYQVYYYYTIQEKLMHFVTCPLQIIELKSLKTTVFCAPYTKKCIGEST